MTNDKLMAKKVIILTEEELTIFDILHEVFGMTKPKEDEITIKDKSSPEKV
jgi:hypothetical protein